jgi:antitoxin HigA-1
MALMQRLSITKTTIDSTEKRPRKDAEAQSFQSKNLRESAKSVVFSADSPLRLNKMMQMYNPPHPGEIIKELCLEPLGLTITRAAEALGVSRKTLSAILNGRAGISPEMAIRLSIAFDTSAESWLNQQTQYDLWFARQKQQTFSVERLVAA